MMCTYVRMKLAKCEGYVIQCRIVRSKLPGTQFTNNVVFYDRCKSYHPNDLLKNEKEQKFKKKEKRTEKQG